MLTIVGMDDPTNRFQMRVSDSFLERLDNWRRGQPTIPSRAEAIRQLVGFGLTYSNDLAADEREAQKREARRSGRNRSMKVENLNAENDG
jgi:hypothetical protein